jgi:beta-lactamase regulating signal transducer with metallopeptidase domain
MGWIVDPFLAELAEWAARATALLAFVVVAAACMRRASAAARHQLWAAAIIALLLLPFAASLSPRVKLAIPTSPGAEPPMPVAFYHLSPPERWSPPPPRAAAVTTTSPRRAEPPRVALPPRTPAPRQSPVAIALGCMWLLGAVIVLRRSVRARMAAGRTIDGTRPADPHMWPRPAGMDVREGEDVELPMTVGALRPVIVLPAREGRRWPAAWRAAVVEHEAAHVRRRDPFLQVLAELACAVYWFHPLVWLAARQLRVQRELAADDDVLARGVPPAEYAELLVTLGCVPAMPPSTGVVLPLLTPSGLKARLLGIVDGSRRRGAGLAMRFAVAAGVLLVLVPTAGAVLVLRPTPWSAFQPGAIVGCALDQLTERPLAGAQVDLWDGSAVRERAVTDWRGCFRSELGPGRSGEMVAYVRKGPVAGRKGIRLGRYGTPLPTTIDVRVAHTISGIMRNERGTPVADGKVRVVSSASWARGPGPDAVAVSGANGQFSFDGILYGEYRLLAEFPAGEITTVLARLDDRDLSGVEITIPATVPIAGYLQDGDGNPVVGARVEESSFLRESGRNLHGRYVDWDETDDEGAFRLVEIDRGLDAVGRDAAGRLVMAAFDDWRSRPGDLVTQGWHSGRSGAAVTIPMRPAGFVTGRLTYPDGRPAAGAHISARVAFGPADFKRTHRPDVLRTTVADAHGRFLIGPLPIGDAHLWSSSEGPLTLVGSRDVRVKGEHDPEVELVLSEPLPFDQRSPTHRRDPVLTIALNGGIYIDNAKVDQDPAALEAAIRNALRAAGSETLLIRGDKRALQRVPSLLPILRRTGVRNVARLTTVDGKLQ